MEIESRRSLCFRVGQDAKAAMWCTKKEINHMQKENQIVGRLQELIETFSSLSWDKKKIVDKCILNKLDKFKKLKYLIQATLKREGMFSLLDGQIQEVHIIKPQSLGCIGGNAL